MRVCESLLGQDVAHSIFLILAGQHLLQGLVDASLSSRAKLLDQFSVKCVVVVSKLVRRVPGEAGVLGKFLKG